MKIARASHLSEKLAASHENHRNNGVLPRRGLHRERFNAAEHAAGEPGNRKPRLDEMQTCLPYLREQIDIIEPRLIVALGATAMEGLLGETQPMARLRGRWHAFQNIPLMATYHPAYLLRNQALGEKRKVWKTCCSFSNGSVERFPKSNATIFSRKPDDPGFISSMSEGTARSLRIAAAHLLQRNQ